MKNGTAELLIESLKATMNRSRWFLVTTTTLSFSIIIIVWNSYWSWDRYFALNFPEETRIDTQKKLIDGWIESSYTDIPLIGGKFHVADASIIGACGLVILMIGLLFSLIREYYLTESIISYAIIDAKDEKETKKYLYHGITSSSLFSFIPISTKENPSENQNEIPKFIFYSLFYLPAFSIFSVISSDILSLFLRSAPFRQKFYEPVWYSISIEEKWLAILMMSIGTALMIFCIYLGARCASYQHKHTLDVNNCKEKIFPP